MMKNYNPNKQLNHNPNWSYIADNPYRILIIGGLASEKTNVLLNRIKHQRPDIDKVYLYVKDPFRASINCVLMEEKKQV